jgi:hypothetical protein
MVAAVADLEAVVAAGAAMVVVAAVTALAVLAPAVAASAAGAVASLVVVAVVVALVEVVVVVALVVTAVAAGVNESLLFLWTPPTGAALEQPRRLIQMVGPTIRRGTAPTIGWTLSKKGKNRPGTMVSLHQLQTGDY